MLQDVEVAIAAIETDITIDTVIPDDFLVQKLRVASRDMQRGKSGGFRLLYLPQPAKETGSDLVYLLFLYAKSDQEDVSLAELESLVSDLSSDESD